MKKNLIIVLTLAMTLSLLPLRSNAAEEYDTRRCEVELQDLEIAQDTADLVCNGGYSESVCRYAQDVVKEKTRDAYDCLKGTN